MRLTSIYIRDSKKKERGFSVFQDTKMLFLGALLVLTLFLKQPDLAVYLPTACLDSSSGIDAPLGIEGGGGGRNQRTLHMIQSVFGNNPLFIDEWEVSLKSLLFNAPLDADLHIHIVCNGAGQKAVEAKLLGVAGLAGTLWRNHVTITVTNTESRIEQLLAYLESVLIGPANNTTKWMDKRVGFGAFGRLFAYEFMLEYLVVVADDDDRDNNNTAALRMDLRQAVYLDVDVVVLSNLNNLVLSMDEEVHRFKTRHESLKQPAAPGTAGRPRNEPLLVWGQGNSGFLGINVLEFDRFWDAVEHCNTIKIDKFPGKNDQWLLGKVKGCYPDIVAVRPHPSPWSVHIGHGYRRAPQHLYSEPNRTVGMVHLQSPDVENWFDGSFHRNGVENRNEIRDGYYRGYVGHFCQRGRGCNKTNGKQMMEVRNTWGLADYYVRISWEWLIYQSATSRIEPGEEGIEIELVFREASKNAVHRTDTTTTTPG